MANGQAPSGERIFASPLARRMAKQAGIDLSSLKGSGPNGRIVRADIQAAQTGGAPAAAKAPAAAPTAGEPAAAPLGKATAQAIGAPHKLVPHSTMRKVIAKRLSESTATIPHFYVSMDIEIDALIALMGQLNGKSPAEGRAGCVSDHHQRHGDQGRGGDTSKSAGGECELDRRRHGFLRRRRYQRCGVYPGWVDHADHSSGGRQRAWRRSAAR